MPPTNRNSTMKTVVTITGIRPDFIRMAATFKLLDAHPGINHIMVHTGQHYDPLLSDVFFKELGIRKPDYNLGIGGANKTHIEQSAELSVSIVKLFDAMVLKPDLVVFLGDSNSVTCAVTLKKEGYKICHIEAGMRSGDRRMLEEINRTVCDHCSDLLLVYHEDYAKRLIQEGVGAFATIEVVGNTIVEPCERAMQRLTVNPKLYSHIVLDIHRPENFKDISRMEKILRFASYLGKSFQLPVKMLSFKRTLENLSVFTEPSDHGIEVVPLMPFKQYSQFVYNALAVISDSGTAQEECALFKTPCIVPRDYTERWQSVFNKCSVMLDVNNFTSHGTCMQYVHEHTEDLIDKIDTRWLYPPMGCATTPTSQLIVNSICQFLGVQ